jgi:ABC-type transport system involved in cytochrome c biogenesis permease subunit
MNLVPLVLYAAAFIGYALHFARRTPVSARLATTTLAAATLAHTFIIGMRTMEVGQVPVFDATSAISMFVWLLAVAYLYTEVTTDERAMGVFILPLILALQAIPAFKASAEVRSSVLRGPVFGIHVYSLLFAYASFALACVIGITYGLLFKEIKTKHLGVFYARLPSLQVLDQMNQRAIIVGWVFLTIGLVAGGVFAAQSQAPALSLEDPKIIVALISWAVYSFELFAARRIGWAGRRTAYLSTVGFAVVLMNFVLVSYLTSSHRF